MAALVPSTFRRHKQTWIQEPACKVQPSRVHGLGLFATRDIEVMELITLYPADALIECLTNDWHCHWGCMIGVCSSTTRKIPRLRWRVTRQTHSLFDRPKSHRGVEARSNGASVCLTPYLSDDHKHALTALALSVCSVVSTPLRTVALQPVACLRA